MAAHTKSAAFNQYRFFIVTYIFGKRFNQAVHRKQIIAIHFITLHAITFGPVYKIFAAVLLRCGGRKSILVILNYKNYTQIPN